MWIVTKKTCNAIAKCAIDETRNAIELRKKKKNCGNAKCECAIDETRNANFAKKKVWKCGNGESRNALEMQMRSKLPNVSMPCMYSDFLTIDLLRSHHRKSNSNTRTTITELGPDRTGLTCNSPSNRLSYLSSTASENGP